MSTVFLAKRGQKVDLTKGTNISKINVALGWDTNKYGGRHDFDLDVVAFLVGENGKVRDDKDLVFYNNLKHVSGSVIHTGDNLTGDGDGDDETIYIDFSKVEAHVQKIAIAVTIHDYAARSQTFGQVSNSYVRVDNADSNQALIKYDLGEDYSIESSVVVCELYRNAGEWKFNAIGAGYGNGLDGLVKDYGLNVG